MREAFDSARECEATRQATINAAVDAAEARLRQPSRSGLLNFGDRILIGDMTKWASSRCVASDDPRLR